MSREKENIPQADLLMGSMRYMGYSFESAIADVIDNSISAHCSVVKVLFPSHSLEQMAVGILDDGEGMTEQSLFEAMRYGSQSFELLRNEDDLGRFGLGLKSASLSQCRILTVASLKDGNICAFSWDYNYIQLKKNWIVIEYDSNEIDQLPYIEKLKAQNQGTLVIWRDFDVLAKSSDGQVFDTLDALKNSVSESLSLIFHRFLTGSHPKLSIYVNNFHVKAKDPFLENHSGTTTKKTRTISINDSNGVERQIFVKPFILPYATKLSDNDRKLIGGLENLRAKQGFYIYRNNRLIIWGTWFGMKPRAELTKNARIRVDIPNTLDDIWSIDIKKQTASIPKRVQNQLKETVRQALDISVTQQTHRGRKNSLDEKIDYIWDRMEGRNKTYYYQINRDSKLYQYVKSQMTETDFDLLETLVGEIERNFPTQQMYIDKSNDAIFVEEPNSRFSDVYQMGITMIENSKKITGRNLSEIIEDIMLSEPFCNYKQLREKLQEYYKDEH